MLVLVGFRHGKTDGFGANPYDPSTPVTVSEWPKVLSFSPEKGQAGDVVTIKGINFGTASKVTFGWNDCGVI